MSKRVEVTIRGLSPLLMHSPRGADPTDPLVREMRSITSKPTKTDADYAQLDWLGFQLAVYHDGEQPVIPDDVLLGAIVAGARAQRKGKEVKAAVDIEEECVPLLYKGPRGITELYEARFVDRRLAGVQKSRVMRVRPRFNEWGASFRLLFDEGVINPRDVRVALERAGTRCGLMDFRPRFGRFEVTSWKDVA